MSASPELGATARDGLALRPMVVADIDEVHALECSVFPHPWSRANFVDSLASGYDAWVLREPDEGQLAGYFLLMYAVDEAHLLDVAVSGERQGSGLGRYLLDRIVARARAMGMGSILLEVRPSNGRALQVYERYGYTQIGRRKGYYPAHEGKREDAIVMRFVL
ncbi:GCN5 family acetyltransferase [Massilia sp. WF1]|uniref:ribosomal protein S18-alanine N-acetyltransferase n=1 Tax=unclassified Massilia TaxID=2609279 RepID=UPI00064A8DCC|nr:MULTISPECIES: ribosomal protein S18-alanine N-acetyltransferase [unclassified Massilia]ALK96662.1 ribosomal-protein-alanine acetyltransferase [Massilia sp. WG5]KLU38280.1 GCN5 family acetyltransferase [Massilia sp. WF1]